MATLLRTGRSPLGAMIRSPLGARTRAGFMPVYGVVRVSGDAVNSYLVRVTTSGLTTLINLGELWQPYFASFAVGSAGIYLITRSTDDDTFATIRRYDLQGNLLTSITPSFAGISGPSANAPMGIGIRSDGLIWTVQNAGATINRGVAVAMFTAELYEVARSTWPSSYAYQALDREASCRYGSVSPSDSFFAGRGDRHLHEFVYDGASITLVDRTVVGWPVTISGSLYDAAIHTALHVGGNLRLFVLHEIRVAGGGGSRYTTELQRSTAQYAGGSNSYLNSRVVCSANGESPTVAFCDGPNWRGTLVSGGSAWSTSIGAITGTVPPPFGLLNGCLRDRLGQYYVMGADSAWGGSFMAFLGQDRQVRHLVPLAGNPVNWWHAALAIGGQGMDDSGLYAW